MRWKIYTVSDIVNETPDLVSNHLAELDVELSKIPEKIAYDLAACQDSSYVRRESRTPAQMFTSKML